MQADPFVDARVTGRLPVGVSLGGAVGDLGCDPQHVELFIDRHHIPRAAWPYVKPRAGIVVEARGVPGGPVAAIVASAWGATAFSIGSVAITWGQIAGLALSFGLQLLAASMFKPKEPRSPSREDREVYSISGARNQLRPWEPVPIVLGTCRMTPPYGANPYTEVVGDRQFLRILVIWGYNTVDVSDIRIGNTSLAKFSDVSIETSTDSTIGLYPNRVEQLDVGVELTQSWVTRTTDAETNEALFTVHFPAGLYSVNDDGDRRTSHRRVIAEYAPTGTSSWVTFHNEEYAAKTTVPFYKGFRIKFPSKGEWDIRIRGDLDQSDQSTQEQVYWLNMKSIEYGAPIKVDGLTTTALRIRASDQLNGVIDQLNAIVARKIPFWTGTRWLDSKATGNPAAVFRDVLIGAANANAVDESRVDSDALGAWYLFCEARGLAYHRVLETQMAVSDLLEEIAAAGFASPTLVDGKWSVVIDTYKTTVVQHFTPRNSWQFSGAVEFPEQPHALRVQFSNATRDFEADEIIVFDDGYSATNATKFEAIRPAGVTTSAQAYRLGRHFLASGRLRPEQFSFTVDFENLVAQRGDLVRLTHDVALIGQSSGRIKAIAGTTVTVDEYCTFEADTEYTFRVRASDGTSISTTATASVGSTMEITVVSAAGMAVGDLFMFGESSAESILALVHSIEPGDDLTARVTCIPYNEDVYTATSSIPSYVSVVSSPLSLSLIGPAPPIIRDVVSDESALQLDMSGIPRPTILLRIWRGDMEVNNTRVTPTVAFRVGWKLSEDESYEFMTVSADSDLVRIYGVEARVPYDLIAYAVDAGGNYSEATTVSGHIVAGLSAHPPAVDTFRVANIGSSAYVEWTYPSIVGDVVGYEIRWHGDQNVTDWSRMIRIATDVPRAARSYMVPSNTGSYAIKPFDALGYRSETALFVSSNITEAAQTNVVLSFTESSSFAGTMDGVAEVSGRLQLDSQLMIADITDLSTVTDIAGDVVREGTYTFWSAQDLGAVYTVRCSWEAEVDADNRRNYVIDWNDLAKVEDISGGASYGEEYAVAMEIAYSRDDVGTGMTWTDWAPFTAGEFTGRHFKFRMVLTTTDALMSPSVDDFSVVLDAPDRVERGEDVTSGASTYSVTFGAAFMDAPNVAINPQDMETGDYFQRSNTTASGFDVDFYDSTDTAVSRTFDWQAIGIGKEAA